MARHLIANITLGTKFYGPDYEPLPDELADQVTNPAVWSDNDAQESSAPVTDTTAPVDLESMTVAELRDHAATHDPPIELPSNALKADIIATIRTAG